jgi:hypothetical protein
MSAEVKLVTLPRKSISGGSEGDVRSTAPNGRFDGAVWTGGDEFRQDVPNATEDPRWYRVIVTRLHPTKEVALYYRIVPLDKMNDDSYAGYSQYDQLHDDDMI